MTNAGDETRVVRVGGYDVPGRWKIPPRRVPVGGPEQIGTYTATIVLDDDGTPGVEDLNIVASPPIRGDVKLNLGAMARSELVEKLEDLMTSEVAHSQGWYIGSLPQDGEWRPTPDAVRIAKEAHTLVYGRKRGARMDPTFLEGIAKAIADRPEPISKTAKVRELAERFDVNPGTVWRWLREADQRR
jgi:hypothetical protein